MNTKVFIVAACIASANAFGGWSSSRGGSVNQVVHHINTTITPNRCGETTVTGSTRYWQYTVTNWVRMTGLSLVNGTCADAGFTEADSLVNPTDTSGFNKRNGKFYFMGRYPYTLHFFFQPSGGGAGKTIVQLAVATPSLSTLVAAVKAGGLVATLSSAGPFTVFAPTNDAFKALGSAVATLLEPKNKALLVKVLTYHVVAGKVTSSVFYEYNGHVSRTVEGQTVKISTALSKVPGVKGVTTVNGATVLKADIVASNGVVHVINKVLLYPGFALPSTGGKTGGKGSAKCVDSAISPPDQYGSCKDYAAKGWCANGGTGSAWSRNWGYISTRVTSACCACGGGGSNIF